MHGSRVDVRRLLAPTLACLLGVGLAGASADTALRGEGRVVAIDEPNGAITVDHGPIGDVIPTMRGEFPVRSREILRRIRIGDRVAFTLTPDPETHGILAITDLRLQSLEGREGLLPLAVVLAAVVAVAVLIAVVLGALSLRRTSHLRSLVSETHELVRKTTYEQQTLRREAIAALEGVARAVAQIARGLGSDLRHLAERVQTARGRAEEPEPPNRRTPMPLVVVRAGDTETFDLLNERLGKPELARVIWDRRGAERRARQEATPRERRSKERRGPAPITWGGLGYLVAEQPLRRMIVVA